MNAGIPDNESGGPDGNGGDRGRKNIHVEMRNAAAGGRIAVLSLDNAATRNSMTLEMGMAFHGEIHRLAAEDPLLRALIITGKNGVFSSGGDFALLKSFSEKDPEENQAYMGSFYRLFLDVRSLPFPVIAAVNGHAVGASLALALACDLRYFVPDGKYAFNFVKIGIHPGMGSSFLVKEVAGLPQAQDLLLTGRFISGEDALRRGLCHAVYPREEILDRALELAEEIAAAAPLAVRLTKQGLYRNHTLDDALAYEAESQARNYATADFREALQAIEEKRKPSFRDE